ncbi:MAG: protein rep [Microcoleus sp.]
MSAHNTEKTKVIIKSLLDSDWEINRELTRKYVGKESHRYIERLNLCSQILESDNRTKYEINFKDVRFCSDKRCLICQWQRSLKWKARMYNVLPKVVEKHIDQRWLFLNFTQKNVPITELRNNHQHMNSSFRRLTQLKNWPAGGWIRSTEVTRGGNDSAHSHCHCLMMVPPSFFSGRNYVNQNKWVSMWQKALKVDYKPILDVRAVKQGRYPMELVPEVMKYVTKESDLVADREWFLEYTRQLQGMRMIAAGGLLKQYLAIQWKEQKNLFWDKSKHDIEQIGSLMFGWEHKLNN